MTFPSSTATTTQYTLVRTLVSFQFELAGSMMAIVLANPAAVINKPTKHLHWTHT